METLDVSGIALEVHRAGKGRPLVYLHAEQFAGRTGPFLELLSQERTVIAPRVKGLTIMQNSLYNGWRFEDIWLDR